MKKIIAAFDGLSFSEYTLQQAVSLAREHNAFLVGIFLQEYTNKSYALYKSVVSETHGGRTTPEDLAERDQDIYAESVAHFEETCRNAGINHNVHKDKKTALKALLHESVFADLLLIDRHETFSCLEDNMPGWFVKHLLHEAHCPVWIGAGDVQSVRRLVFLYDGEPASVFAMKMATYLFPDMSNMSAQLICAKPGTLNLHLPNNKLVHEWMKRYYPLAKFKVVQGGSPELIELLKGLPSDSLIVTGAYRRNQLSMWLYPSLADDIMRQVKAPLLITHS